MSELRNVSSNPHIRAKDTTSHIMLMVIISLLPAAGFGVYNFGLKALFLIVLTIASTVLSEYVFEKIVHKKVTIGDLSAVVTGLLLALNLPVSAPWWMAVLGGVFAIVIVKMLFGGLGQNFMNPALGARCFLLLSFTSYMTNFNCDAYSGATPLAILKQADASLFPVKGHVGPISISAMQMGSNVNVMDMIIGKTAGTIGETSMIALVIGACILIMCGIIDLKIPGTYIVTFVIFICLFGGHGINLQYISAQLAGGGLMLGAFFMATDYVTRPITKNGQYLFGIILGILTGIFRIFGPSAEGVSYAIIIGNLLVPLIEKVTFPKAFGKGGENA